VRSEFANLHPFLTFCLEVSSSAALHWTQFRITATALLYTAPLVLLGSPREMRCVIRIREQSIGEIKISEKRWHRAAATEPRISRRSRAHLSIAWYVLIDLAGEIQRVQAA